jgi:hypothetical protein
LQPQTTIHPGTASVISSIPGHRFEEKFHSLTAKEQVALLSVYSDEQLSALLRHSERLAAVAWRLEVIGLGILADRLPARRGRGNVDVEGRGVRALVAQKAAELGCSSGAIWTSIRIYRTFFKNGKSGLTILQEKGFYLAALEDQDPPSAYRVFVRFRQRQGAQFKVADAERVVRRRRQKRELRAAGHARHPSELAQNLEETLAFLLRQQRACPEVKAALKFYDGIVEDTRDFLADILDKVAQARVAKIFRLSQERVIPVNELSLQTGMSTGTVQLIMRRLENERVVFKPEADTPAWRTVVRIKP